LFSADKQTVQRMAPYLQRVLIADASPQSARFLNELMRDISRAQVWFAPTVDRALKQAAICEPQIIFVELSADGIDGLAFTRQLRRSSLACRQAPVVMVSGEATATAILAARDAGVHEFLRKPFSMKDLLRRLEAVTLRSRDWVEGVGYIGPDRRRFNSGDYTGPLKRGSDTRESPDEAKLQQALKILRVAAAAVEKDPQQAMRAMLAQAGIIEQVARNTADVSLGASAAKLYRHIEWSQGGQPPTVAQMAPHVAPLLVFLKEDGEREAA
jgi:two-component system, response regulator PdtaR